MLFPRLWKVVKKKLKVISSEVVFDSVPLDVEYYQSGGGSFQAKQFSILEAVTSVAVFKRDGILLAGGHQNNSKAAANRLLSETCARQCKIRVS